MRRFLVIAASILATLGVALAAACGGGGDDDEAGLLAVAFSVDPDAPSVSAFIGDATVDPFLPGEGTFYIEAVDGDGLVIAVANVELQQDEPVSFPGSFDEAGGEADPARAADLDIIAGFLADSELAKLTVYEVVSGGFESELFDTEAVFDETRFAALFDAYADIAAQEDDVLAAVGRLEVRADATVRRPLVSAAAPTAGVFDDIKKELLGFFGYAGDAGERAAADIAMIAAEMSPDEKQEALDALRPAFREGVNSFDDLLSKLQSGELNNEAAQIRNDLWKDPGFYGAAQSVCDCGRPELHTAHQEGAELVTKGAELNAKIIQTVLAAKFPDISKGFDLADKANEWAEYIDMLYKDPLGTLEGQTREAIQEAIKEKILESLGECCPELAEELAEEIAGTVAEGAVDAIPELTPLIKGTATPPPAGATATARAGQAESGTATAAAARPSETGTAAAGTRTATPAGPTATPAPPTPTPRPATATPVPSADTSWIDPLVDQVAAELLAAGEDPIDIAVATEEFRSCLFAQVEGGASMSQALANCVEPQPSPDDTATATKPPATSTPRPPTATPRPPTATPVPAAFSVNGTFGLSQSDSGCNFSAAPFTSGSFMLTIDLATGTASGSLSGSGSGKRNGLRCGDTTGDMSWNQSYTANFSGSIDPATGSLFLTGTLSGSGSNTWSNCEDEHGPSSCPSGSSGGYSFPVQITGTISPSSKTGGGSILVTMIGLPTSGTWSVP